MRGRWCLAAAGVIGSCATVGSAQVVSPGIVNPSNGHTYYLTGTTNWIWAAMEAHRRGGRLATINDATEQAWVYDTFSRYGGTNRLLWVGLSDGGTEGSYRWINGEPSPYTNWAPGEPNAADPTEDYVAMYYAGHSAQGRWNDWGFRERDPIGIPFAGVIEVDPTRLGPTVLADIDPTWRTIAPEGNRQGQPTGSVGTAWEAANPGWRSDINFDTTTWEAPTPRGGAWWGPDADTPLYLRKVFTLGGPVTEATLLVGVDDDAIVYVNGTLVASDTAVGVGGMGPINIAPLLRVGQNLIAVKAHDSFGGSEVLYVQAAGTVVPEPGVATGIVIGAGVLELRRRRRSQQAFSATSPL